jgi:hypothetical protein
VSLDNAVANLGVGATTWYATFCPAGKRAVGGGFEFINGTGGQLTVIASHPTDSSATGWRVQVRNNTGILINTTIRVHAICATVP